MDETSNETVLEVKVATATTWLEKLQAARSRVVSQMKELPDYATRWSLRKKR